MAIEITALCETFRCLPRPGGLLDQPGYLMFLINTVLAVQREKEEMDQKKQESQNRQAQVRSRASRGRRPAPRR